jgi:hypothetical protein
VQGLLYPIRYTSESVGVVTDSLVGRSREEDVP